MSVFNRDALLGDFFVALDGRRLSECAALLEMARQEDHSAEDDLWLDYLACILLVEQAPPRWDLAAEQLQRLLTADPRADLLARAHLEIAFGADYLGDYEAAIEHNQQSLALFTMLGDEGYQARVLRNLGVAHGQAFQRGQEGPTVLDKALDCCERSLVIAQRRGDEALAANIELHLGNIAQWQGRWQDALTHYTARSEWCRRAGGRERSLALALNNTGEIHHHLGDWALAEACYREALDLLAGLPAGDPYEEADIWANLSLTHRAAGHIAAALAASDKAIALVESLRDPLQSQTARIGFFGTRVPVYEQRVELELAQGNTHAALTMLERAKSRAFLELLVRRGGRGEGEGEETSPLRQSTQPLSAEEIQSKLPDDTLLIEYLVTPRQAGAFLISAHGLEVAALEADVGQRLRRAFEPGAQRLRRMTPAAGRLHDPFMLAALRHLLWTPLAAAVQGWSRIGVIPHGPLHYLPFPALVDQPAGEEPDIVVAPSATVFLELDPPSRPTSEGGALIVHHGSDLKYAALEARMLVEKLGGRLLIGADASIERVLAEAGGQSLLHFACHGCFDPLQPLASGLDLVDGRLTAAQIMNDMHLQADLVTLSGCETGRSRLLAGDELVGLVRAFLAVGARAVLVSLWPVDDVSTRMLMERFYEALLADADPATALREAQRWLRQMTTAELAAKLAADGLPTAGIEAEVWRLQGMRGQARAGVNENDKVFDHPYFWAPFILVGGRRARS